MTENEITIIINTFRSGVKLLKCLQSIESKYKVIIVENSSNHSFKKEIENKFSNVECIMTGENLGYAKGNNLGLSKIKSKYALILNPDCVLEKNAIKNFLNTATKLDDFAIIGPTHENGSNNKTDKINSVTEVESVKGFAMFLNMSEFKEVGFFDNNFFIYLEEIDLCKRLRKTNKKIFSDSSIVVKHQGGSLTKRNIITRWNFLEIGTGCGLYFILIENIKDLLSPYFCYHHILFHLFSKQLFILY
jgi:GT2 family glycosyltransferase